MEKIGVNKEEIVGYVVNYTIKSAGCTILIPENSVPMCESCRCFRPNFRARSWHIRSTAEKQTDRLSASSNVPIAKLNKAEKEIHGKKFEQSDFRSQKKI